MDDACSLAGQPVAADDEVDGGGVSGGVCGSGRLVEVGPVWCFSDGTPMFYDRAGVPLTARRWAELRGERSYRELARTRFVGGEVITCWLGIDQGDGLSGPPQIFGTIVHHDTNVWSGEVFDCDEVSAFVRHKEVVAAMTGDFLPGSGVGDAGV